jgi:hypothetical protein
MSQELFVAVADSDIAKVINAIETMQRTNENSDLTINNDIFPNTNILDIATRLAKDQSPEHPSNEVVRLLREAGAFLSSEIPVAGVVEGQNEENLNRMTGLNLNAILGGNNLSRVPSPSLPPKPPLHPVQTTPTTTIPGGIASRPKRGGRKTKRVKSKSKKSRKHLRR